MDCKVLREYLKLKGVYNPNSFKDFKEEVKRKTKRFYLIEGCVVRKSGHLVEIEPLIYKARTRGTMFLFWGQWEHVVLLGRDIEKFNKFANARENKITNQSIHQFMVKNNIKTLKIANPEKAIKQIKDNLKNKRIVKVFRYGFGMSFIDTVGRADLANERDKRLLELIKTIHSTKIYKAQNLYRQHPNYMKNRKEFLAILRKPLEAVNGELRAELVSVVRRFLDENYSGKQ